MCTSHLREYFCSHKAVYKHEWCPTYVTAVTCDKVELGATCDSLRFLTDDWRPDRCPYCLSPPADRERLIAQGWTASQILPEYVLSVEYDVEEPAFSTPELEAALAMPEHSGVGESNVSTQSVRFDSGPGFGTFDSPQSLPTIRAHSAMGLTSPASVLHVDEYGRHRDSVVAGSLQYGVPTDTNSGEAALQIPDNVDFGDQESVERFYRARRLFLLRSADAVPKARQREVYTEQNISWIAARLDDYARSSNNRLMPWAQLLGEYNLAFPGENRKYHSLFHGIRSHPALSQQIEKYERRR